MRAVLKKNANIRIIVVPANPNLIIMHPVITSQGSIRQWFTGFYAVKRRFGIYGAHFVNLEQRIIMSHTSFTAVIITFHNWSALGALLSALIISLFAYFLGIKRLKHQMVAIVITFFLALIISQGFMEKIFLQKPCSIEIVRAG